MSETEARNDQDAIFALCPKPEGANAYIQWKGTDACLDVRCDCGHDTHMDGDYLYYVRCPKCGTTYMLPHTVPLYRVPDHLMHEVDPDVTRVMAD